GRITQGAGAAVQSVLRRLLVEARTNPDGAQRAGPDRTFIGEASKVRFVSSFVPQGQFGGLWRYEIALDASERAGESSALVLTQQLVRPATSTTGPPLRTVVLNGGPRPQRALLRRRRQRERRPAVAGRLATSLPPAAPRFRGRRLCST